MKKIYISVAVLSVLAARLWAGALLLTISNPSTDAMALAQHVALVAHITACHAPEKTIVTATAEGIVDNGRKSIALKVIPLASPSAFGIVRGWPDEGRWAVRVIASNPEYEDYTTGLTAPIDNGSVQFAAAKRYYHAPTNAEMLLAMK